MNTFEKVQELLADQLDISTDKISLETDLIADLDADSIDVFEMLVAMEEEFNVTLPDEEVANLKTVGDAVKFIDQAMAK